MPNGNNPVVNQHYIPRMYLRRFSEIKTVNNKEKELIWQFNVETMQQIPTQVNIERICYKENLYEIRDIDNSFVNQNAIEKLLGDYEKVFSDNIGSIEKKASCEQNYRTRCFLSDKEKTLLLVFMTLQILRMPRTLQCAEEVANEIFGNNLKANQAKNIAILNCLQIYESLDVNEKNIFFYIVRWFEDMSFIIGKSESENFFTCDKPIYLLHKNKDTIDFFNSQLQEIIFPLSSNLVLWMRPFDKTTPDYRNRLVKLNNHGVEKVNGSIAISSQKWIYSKYQLTTDEIALIKEAKQKI